MADKEWSQSPLVVYPFKYHAAAVKSMKDYNNGAVLKENHINATRAAGLLLLLSLLKEYGDTYQNARTYYESIIYHRRALIIPRLALLDHAQERTFADRRAATNVDIDIGAPPPERMVVTFSKSARRRWDAPDID